MRLFLFLAVLAGIVLILLATQDANTAWTTLNLPFTATTVSSPLVGWIAGSLGLGFLMGYLAALPGRIGASSRARRAERELEQAGLSAQQAQVAAVDARADARAAHAEADETARLAEEVARRTQGVRGPDAPLPPPPRRKP